MLVYPFYIIAGVVAIVNLASTLLQKDMVRLHPFLSQASFFIYASHTLLILGKANGIMGKLIPAELSALLAVRYLLTPCLAVAACLCLYALLRRYAPGLLKVLMGNR